MLIDEPNLKGVKTCLEDIIDGTKSDDFMGCLMMNHLTQKKSISAKVNKIITDFCSDMEKLFETALRNAQANGEIPLSKEPAELASVVMFFIHGFVLYGRHQNVENKMPKFYEIVMQTLQN